jgi:tRNA(adenine34) deaminase
MTQENIKQHETWMRLALEQARLAAQSNEVPIGAVIVDTQTQQVIAKAHNLTITYCDPTAHAEVLAIRDACTTYGAQRIPEYDLYVTLEPCPMCSAAISFARVNHIYFGATDSKSGGLISGPCLSTSPTIHHKPKITGGILAEEAAQLLQQFFKERR